MNATLYRLQSMIVNHIRYSNKLVSGQLVTVTVRLVGKPFNTLKTTLYQLKVDNNRKMSCFVSIWHCQMFFFRTWSHVILENKLFRKTASPIGESPKNFSNFEKKKKLAPFPFEFFFLKTRSVRSGDHLLFWIFSNKKKPQNAVWASPTGR